MLIALFVCGNTYAQDQPELIFEPSGGVYGSPVDVRLDAGQDAKIYYTIDGSVPGSGSMKYSEPIHVSNVKVIRAVAYVNGRRSKVITNSYFCDRPYTLPVVSLAVNPEVLWDSVGGIYVKGLNSVDTVEPYLDANYWKDWERRVNIEMYQPNGELCFNQEAGVSVFGGFSRWLPQKSLGVYARSSYGKTRFEYPIFEERDFKKYKSFIIRNSGGDFQRTHLRDAYMTQLAAPTGIAYQAYQPVVFYINGEYWGIQNLREKISEHYLKSNFGVDKNNVDILRQNRVARHGNSKEYKKLLAFLENKDMSSNQTIEELDKFMDIHDYLRYNIAEVYSDNRDAGGNIRYWKERNDSAKWRWVFYDLDLGLGNNAPKGYKRNTLEKFTSVNNEAWPDPPWSTFIIRSLLENKDIQTRYINMFADHLNTVYHPDTAVALLHKMSDVIAEEMKFHTKRWGQTYKNWKYHLNIVETFVRNRPYYCRQHIMEKFNLEDTAYVSIEYPGDVAEVKFNSLKINRDFKGVYFTGVPVKISVQPKHDYDFVGWEGRDVAEPVLEIVLEKDEVFIPLVRPKKPSPYKDQVIFSELMIYQQEADTSEDWIELYNKGNTEVSLDGWGFTQEDYEQRFIFPSGTTIAPGSTIIIAQKKENYATKYNTDTVMVFGDFEFGLSSVSERLKLYDGDGLIVDSLSYKWDKTKSDSAFSYNLVHPDSARHKQSNWVPETPNPGRLSRSYDDFLIMEENKREWTKLFYIGGGGFFFMLVAGIWYFRFYRKKNLSK